MANHGYMTAMIWIICCVFVVAIIALIERFAANAYYRDLVSVQRDGKKHAQGLRDQWADRLTLAEDRHLEMSRRQEMLLKILGYSNWEDFAAVERVKALTAAKLRADAEQKPPKKKKKTSDCPLVNLVKN